MNTRRRPIEISEDIVGQDCWFSVVISNVEGKVEVQDIQNKLYIVGEDEETAGYKQCSNGTYLSRYAECTDYIDGIFVIQHTTLRLKSTDIMNSQKTKRSLQTQSNRYATRFRVPSFGIYRYIDSETWSEK